MKSSGHKLKLRKRDSCTLKGIVSKNYRITAAKVTAELRTHPEDHVSTKKSPVRSSQIQYPQ